jgi:hypothetical protein
MVEKFTLYIRLEDDSEGDHYRRSDVSFEKLIEATNISDIKYSFNEAFEISLKEIGDLWVNQKNSEILFSIIGASRIDIKNNEVDKSLIISFQKPIDFRRFISRNTGICFCVGR